MSALKKTATFLDAEAFFAWQATEPVRHEYYYGEVFAMAGGTREHNRVSLNVAFALNQHLRDSRCEVYATDVALALVPSKHYAYPDVFVTCDPRDDAPEFGLVQAHPLLVVEVLSPSTAKYDQTGKFGAYSKLDSLRELVYIDPEDGVIVVHRGFDHGKVTTEVLDAFGELGLSATLRLESVDLTISLAEIFARVRFKRSRPLLAA